MSEEPIEHELLRQGGHGLQGVPLVLLERAGLAQVDVSDWDDYARSIEA